jgi:drug/metabolite transporter (DMT)-like permease
VLYFFLRGLYIGRIEVKINRYYTGVLLVVISAASFALMPVFAVFAYRGTINVITLLFTRFGLAAVMLFSYLIFKKKNLVLTRQVLIKLMIFGGVLYTLQSCLYFASVKYINVSLQAMLFYTYPIFVTVIAIMFFKEKLTKILLLAICVSMAGMVLVLGTSFSSINFLGVFLVLGAALIYSFYINLANRLLHNIPSDITTAYICLFSALSFLLVGKATGNLSFHFSPVTWWPIIAIAFFSTTVAIVTFFKGMEILGSTRTAVISMIEPFITITVSSLLFHDKLGPLQWLGGILVLTAAYLVVKFKPEVKPETR